MMADSEMWQNAPIVAKSDSRVQGPPLPAEVCEQVVVAGSDGRRLSLDQISIIVPVKNEEASIERLILGLIQQTLKPVEIIVADGGSTDRTLQIIGRLQAESPVPVILLRESQAFPGRGRNLAIAQAANEWLGSIDAGIVPQPDWLQELVSTAVSNPEAKVIYGRYEPVTDSYFTECAAISYLPPPGTPTRFIASSLLHRSAWKAAAAFREDLRSGEDLLFFRSLDHAGVQSAYAERAVVRWDLQPTAARTFRRFATYSRYGMKAGLADHWQVRVTGLYLLLLTLIAASCFWWPIIVLPIGILTLRAQKRIYQWYAGNFSRRWVEVINPRRILAVAGIAILVDLAMFWGMLNFLMRDRIGKTLRIVRD
jgi:glycosyltransferase involved in cell wall biosynthesis